MNYRQKLYAHYVQTHTGTVPIGEIHRQWYVWSRYYRRLLPKNRDARILDIGEGNGSLVLFLQKAGFKNTMGIDESKEQVELAHKMGIESIIHCDVEDFLSQQVEAYDMIFAVEVIEHFTKDEVLQVLEAVHKALRFGGLFIAQTPNGENLFSGRLRYGDFTHENAFTTSSLAQVLKAVGFKDIQFYPTGPVPLGLKSTMRYLMWKMIESAIRMYKVIETGSASGIFTPSIIAVAHKQL